MLQKPVTLLVQMGLREWKNHVAEFESVDTIKELAGRFHPTPDDVLDALKHETDETKLDLQKRSALKDLRIFIRNLPDEELHKFLRFVTGSALTPKEILIDFSDEKPFTVRTCSALIYIPTNKPRNEFVGTLKKVIGNELYLPLTEF